MVEKTGDPHMIELTVADVLTDSARTVAPETSVTEAAQLLRDPAVSALVVLDEDAVVGVLTDSDFVALVAEDSGARSVDAVMSAPVVTIPSTASIATAAKRMRELGVKHLPVVEDGTYRGLLPWTALLPYLPPRRLEIDWQRESVHVEPTDERQSPVDEHRTRLKPTPTP
jgi:signal-transduction protein with cAMP-binding, CBS, and nucleotidyltransferase domain